jgi:hypothetical protein
MLCNKMDTAILFAFSSTVGKRTVTVPGQLASRRQPYSLQVVENMVRPERFELPTFWFVARRSIQLS